MKMYALQLIRGNEYTVFNEESEKKTADALFSFLPFFLANMWRKHCSALLDPERWQPLSDKYDILIVKQ